MKIPFNLTGKLGLVNQGKESIDIISWNLQGSSISKWNGTLEICAVNKDIFMTGLHKTIYLQLDKEAVLFTGNVTINKIDEIEKNQKSFKCEFIGKGDLADIPAKLF